MSFVGDQILLRLFGFSGLNAWTVFFFTLHEEYLGVVALMRTIPTSLPLTSLCDPPLLFVYFKVNIGVSYCLDYVEGIYDGGPLCPCFNP